MERLLTDVEMNVIKGGYIDWLQKNCSLTDIETIEKALRIGFPREVAKVQNSKTLMAVGEWLESRLKEDMSNFTQGFITLGEIETLKRGEMPE